MADAKCREETEYRKKNGKCCDRCRPGEHWVSDCNGPEKKTECKSCPPGYYTDKPNHLPSCRLCKECSSHNRLVAVSECTITKDRVCECEPGFYCSTNDCEHCQPVTKCPPGQGVKVQPSRTNNTVCAPCERGTFSNVTDYISPCKEYTRCEIYGRTLKSSGNQTADAICGHSKPNCAWMLPAGLWAGFVLNVIVFAIIFWTLRRKSCRAVKTRVPPALVEVAPATLDTPLELSSHCQETRIFESNGKLSPFNPDDTPVICSIQDSLESSPLKGSVSFVKSSHTNGNAGHCHENFFRSHSEPQEDEWCETQEVTAY
ncbi:tumor necrosis factor receptor superfamily member 5 [Pholidichthys leucotaenia]